MARALGNRRRIVLLDGDEAGHEVLREANAKQRIRDHFGPSVFDENGNVDRRALGRLVFGPTPEHREARAALEGIVHPRIREKLAAGIEEARQTDGVEVVVVDAAVLFEAGWNDLCNTVVFVETPLEQRQQRVQAGRGWSAEDLKIRESSQYSLDRKRTACQYAVDNSGTVEQAAAELEQIVDSLRRD